MTITLENDEYVATCAAGRVRFRSVGYRQREIILEFDDGAGKAALITCREALAYLFDHTDTLIVRGYIERGNAASRAFGNALGFSTRGEKNGLIEKRMTQARWRQINAGH